ncbi:MAG: Fe-only nitrogenase accessory AnfO family protein [Methanocorpusculum sp.]|uniref:Fe-only nitrogenase accessory AnfO family protein n=1 Tax=Methanocorpusculum sp. TaxID=2058474 RepID=UPI002722238A|nr:Fe-only nitrogenase accessory AnfO family protein [Methanocorpusculum sp.]MDO9522484.1 Fe-only nitrogenase accessory AnfO family protein [Methanocorpusculum sp.]
MAKEIAVCCEDTDAVATLSATTHIKKFRREQGVWELVGVLPITLGDISGIADLRKAVASILELLDGCKILVASSFIGAAAYHLERNGIHLWESLDADLFSLDDILSKDEADQDVSETVETKHNFVTYLGNGVYQISLTEIQRQNGTITSKQILMPILSAGTFYELQIDCCHIPPWLEGELAGERFDSRVEPLTGSSKFRLFLTKKTCASGI